ncbi:MAG: tetratricopeptide repeat protein [Planctomycetaceae bacterium]
MGFVGNRLPNPPRVLVLTTGRLVEGNISENAGGYVVDLPNGSMLVPSDQVKFTARSKLDAYRQLRDEAPSPQPRYRLALARWCITNGLYDQAKQELSAVLATEPDHAEARATLRRLEELLNPENAIHRTPIESPPRTHDGFKLPEASSLSRLSPETAREYVTRVQPVLLNKCGNARCHGSAAENELRLSHSFGRNNHRIFAERNLAAILEYVNLEHPDRSPLLQVPRGNHGRGGRTIFVGPAGAEQRELLEVWVRRVAQERRDERREMRAGESRDERREMREISAPDFRLPPYARKTLNLDTLNSGLDDTAGKSPHPALQPADDHLLKDVLKDERPDAFDPAEFNQMTDPRDAARGL